MASILISINSSFSDKKFLRPLLSKMEKMCQYKIENLKRWKGRGHGAGGIGHGEKSREHRAEGRKHRERTKERIAQSED
jgi:hypothetical protein